MIDWLSDWLIDSFIHWFIDSLIHWFIDSLIHSLIHWFIDSLIHLFIDSLIHWFICSFIHSASQPVSQSVSWLVGPSDRLTIRPSIRQSVIHPCIRSFVRSFVCSFVRSFFRVVQSVIQSVCQPASQFVSQSVSLTVSWPVGWSFGQSISQSIKQEQLTFKPVIARRWLQPDLSWLTCTPDINPPISCGVANICRSCCVNTLSGGLPHCPCWFEPQQKTCPAAVNAAEWCDPATTCVTFWGDSGNTTIEKAKRHSKSNLPCATVFLTCFWEKKIANEYQTMHKERGYLEIQLVWDIKTDNKMISICTGF